MSQKEEIMAYMKDFGSITSMDAFMDIGCTRLAARISDIEDDGVSVLRTKETRLNRFGKAVSYTRYSLGG